MGDIVRSVLVCVSLGGLRGEHVSGRGATRERGRVSSREGKNQIEGLCK